jgi:hypothetical protein
LANGRNVPKPRGQHAAIDEASESPVTRTEMKDYWTMQFAIPITRGWAMKDEVENCPADLVFHLDEVGVSEWEDRKDKKVVIPVAISTDHSSRIPFEGFSDPI